MNRASCGSIRAATIKRAHQHLNNGKRDKVSARLGAVLHRFDPATASREDGRLLAAARLWLQAVDHTFTRGWERYVHEATLAQHQPLAQPGDPLAVVVRDLLLQALVATPGIYPSAIAEGRLALAETLHHVGSCNRAIELAHLTWADVCRPDSDPVLLLRAGTTLIRILAACGRTSEADHVRDQLAMRLADRHRTLADRADLQAVATACNEHHRLRCSIQAQARQPRAAIEVDPAAGMSSPTRSPRLKPSLIVAAVVAAAAVCGLAIALLPSPSAKTTETTVTVLLALVVFVWRRHRHRQRR